MQYARNLPSQYSRINKPNTIRITMSRCWYTYQNPSTHTRSSPSKRYTKMTQINKQDHLARLTEAMMTIYTNLRLVRKQQKLCDWCMYTDTIELTSLATNVVRDPRSTFSVLHTSEQHTPCRWHNNGTAPTCGAQLLTLLSILHQ